MNKEINQLMMQLPEKVGLLENSFPPVVQEKTKQLRARYGDALKFGAAFNPSLQKAAAAYPERTFMGTAPTLTIVKATYGASPAEGWIMSQLEDLNKYTSIENKMNADQMEDTARLILLEYHYFKASELLLFFHRFKLGKYGPLYGSVDPLRIMQALIEFNVERRAEIAKYEMKQRRERWIKDWDKKCVTRQEYLAQKARANCLKNENTP